MSRIVGKMMGAYTVLAKISLGISGSFRSLLPAKIKEFNCRDMLVAYSVCSDEIDTAGNRAVFMDLTGLAGILQGHRGADLQFEGGFSEEASALLRNGFEVEPLRMDCEMSARGGKYDFVVISNIINHIPDGDLRRGFLLRVKDTWRPGGKIVLLCTEFQRRRSWQEAGRTA